jgi:hypothetical protein
MPDFSTFKWLGFSGQGHTRHAQRFVEVAKLEFLFLFSWTKLNYYSRQFDRNDKSIQTHIVR